MQKIFPRTFLAIDLPKSIKRNIVKNIKHLHSQLSLKQIKWVKEKNLHLTLHFLGKITETEYQNIDQKIKELAKDFAPFTINLTNLKPFPSQRKFHILALMIQPSKPLEKLVTSIKLKLQPLEIRDEKRKFKPHITLGRISKPHLQLKHLEMKLASKSSSFKVDKVTLFSSETNSNGPIYTPIATYHLFKL